MGAALAKDPATPKSERDRLKEESRYFLERARNYVNLFDPKTKLFQGRDADGNFLAGRPAGLGWRLHRDQRLELRVHRASRTARAWPTCTAGRRRCERSSTRSSPPRRTPTGPAGTAASIHEMLEARAVRMGQLGMSNQPSHHIPYMYNFAGAPAKTQATVREILRRLYVGSEIGQGYLGDEDNGEMSSWYILSSLGLYPLQAGSSEWAIGSPQFTRMTVHRTQRRHRRQRAEQQHDERLRAGRARSTARSSAACPWIVAALAKGGTIDFQMGPKPSSWGTGKNDAPPSLTKGDEAPKPLQDATGPGLGTATATGGQDASKLFDDSSTTQLTFTSATPQITWAFRGGKQKPTYYTVTSGASAGDPADWRLQGSNDGITWTTVDSRSRPGVPVAQPDPAVLRSTSRDGSRSSASPSRRPSAPRRPTSPRSSCSPAATSTSVAATSRSPPRTACTRRPAYPSRCRWPPSPAATPAATRPPSTGVTARRSPRAP